jgi:hypothetical protein
MIPTSILTRYNPAIFPAKFAAPKPVSSVGTSYTPPFCPQCPLPCVPSVPESKSCWPFVIVKPAPEPVDPCNDASIAPCNCNVQKAKCHCR